MKHITDMHLFHESTGDANEELKQKSPAKTMECILTDNDMNTEIWTEVHAEEFKQCMGTYNIKVRSDSFETITWAILFYEHR